MKITHGSRIMNAKNLGKRILRGLSSFIEKIDRPFTYGILYLVAIPGFALIFLSINNDFVHSTITQERTKDIYEEELRNILSLSLNTAVLKPKFSGKIITLADIWSTDIKYMGGQKREVARFNISFEAKARKSWKKTDCFGCDDEYEDKYLGPTFRFDDIEVVVNLSEFSLDGRVRYVGQPDPKIIINTSDVKVLDLYGKPLGELEVAKLIKKYFPGIERVDLDIPRGLGPIGKNDKELTNSDLDEFTEPNLYHAGYRLLIADGHSGHKFDELLRQIGYIYNGAPVGGVDGFETMLYFSAVTITTLGYGDILPITHRSRRLIAIESVYGILMIGLFLSSLERRRRRKGSAGM